MDNALLPTDVCETVIDHCDFRQGSQGANPGDNYETLRACTLVCTSWVPRSRHNLLREVRLRNFDDIDLLLKLLKERPRLADLVTGIYMPEYAYVPFAYFPLSGGLRNCRRFTIDPGIWSTVYPPGYSRWISGFQTLTDLVLGVSSLSAPEIFHIIWSLPLLGSLTLVESNRSLRVERFGAHLAERLNAKSELKCCQKLTHLTVDSSRYDSLLSTAGFPPPGVFGSSVTHLDLRMSEDIVVSEHFLECLGSFSSLASLAISVGEPATSFTKPTTPYRGSRFGVAPPRIIHVGSSWQSLFAAFTGSLSTAGCTLPSSSVVETEPLHATEPGYANKDAHENGHEHRAIRTTRAFQAEEMQDYDWGTLQALQDPSLREDLAVGTSEPRFQLPKGYNIVTAGVLQIVPYVRSGRAFRELRVSLRPRSHFADYKGTRAGLLDALCGARMKQALSRLPSIEAFVLDIAEDEKEWDVQWWTEQVVNRLPALRGVVQIDQHRPTEYRERPLWRPESTGSEGK